MGAVEQGAWVSGHAGQVVPVAFSPDGRRFVAGDRAGGLAVYMGDGERLVGARAPAPGRYAPAKIHAVAWSRDNTHVAAMENDVVRLRRASDLAILAEAPGVAVGPLVFGGNGAWLAVGAGRELLVLAVSSLQVITRLPVERRSLDVFSVDGITADPSGSVVVTCDDGGRDEDERGNTTGRDPAQVTLFDATTGASLAVIEQGNRAREVLFDPWRRRLYALTDAGIGVHSPDGALISKWRVYEERAGTHAMQLAVGATFLATNAVDRERPGTTIDLWHPLSFRAIGSFEVPGGAAPTWMVGGPDGSVLVTGAEGGFRLWNVMPDRAPFAATGEPGEDAASELVRLAGPIVHASTSTPEEIERAIADGRAMVIHIDSCMGSRDISLSARLSTRTAPDLVLARPVPAHLREVADASWDASDDVYRDLRVEPPRVRGRTKRPRVPPGPVFPKVVHEGRGGYIAIDAGWREYRYPIELVSEGRFCIHYPAGNRLRDQAVHLAALEELCRAEPEKWTLARRDRRARR